MCPSELQIRFVNVDGPKNNQEAKIALYTVDINKQVCICFTNHYIIYYKQHTCVSKRSIYILCDKTFCNKGSCVLEMSHCNSTKQCD